MSIWTDVGLTEPSLSSDGAPAAVTALERLLTELKPIFNIQGSRFGGVCDDVADDTGAVVDAIAAAKAAGGGSIFIPARTKVAAAAMAIDTLYDVMFFGPSVGVGVLHNTGTADTFVVTGANARLQFQTVGFENDASAGHIFNAGTSSCSYWNLDHCSFTNNNPAKGAWHQTDGDYIGMQVEHFTFNAEPSAVAPNYFWNVLNGLGGLNGNRWAHGLSNCYGTYPINIESTASGVWAYDNVVEDVVFEIPLGGCVRARSVNKFRVEDCGVWDLTGPTTADLFDVGANVIASRYMTFRGVQRHGGRTGGTALTTAGSDGATLPQLTLHVDDTTVGFASAGTALVSTSDGFQTVAYTGKTGTTLTGCSGGTGVMGTSATVISGIAFADIKVDSSGPTLIENCDSAILRCFVVNGHLSNQIKVVNSGVKGAEGLAWLNRPFDTEDGIWRTYIPEVTGGAWAHNSGGLKARWMVADGICHVRADWLMSASDVVDTVGLVLSLPVPASAVNADVAVSGTATDQGTASYSLSGGLATSTTVRPYTLGAGGLHGEVTSTAPHAWSPASHDELVLAMSYRID